MGWMTCELVSSPLLEMLNDHAVTKIIYKLHMLTHHVVISKDIAASRFLHCPGWSSWIELGEGHYSLRLEVLENVQPNEA